MTLENRVAVITGASGALGATLARQLAEAGANLALLERNSDKLTALARTLALAEERVLTLPVDLTDPQATSAAAEAVAARFNRIDVLLHLVGGWTGGKTLQQADPADLESMLVQHVWTSFNALRAFAPHLVSNRWGRVVMITTPLASRPTGKNGAYAVGKAGQEALMLTLSQELKGTGVTANLLQVRAIDAKREKVSAPSAENAGWSTPEELAAAVMFLLSDEAGTINGARVPVFGSYA